MKAIDIKLLRDFKRLWLQALAIALVLACGVAILLTSIGMYTALADTRAAYYERNRFADVFSSATRAPEALLTEIGQIENVLNVEARITGHAILDIPGLTKSNQICHRPCHLLARGIRADPEPAAPAKRPLSGLCRAV